MWNGVYWKTEYSDDEVKIKEWQGITINPDEDINIKEN